MAEGGVRPRMRGRVGSVVLLLVAVLAPTAVAAAAGRRSPESRVDALFARFDRAEAPGCAVGVSDRGKTSYVRGFGAADLSSGASITRNTRFDIASVSKQLTAALVYLLAADGTLSLEDRIVDRVPELPAAAGDVTIEQLLHHTSGIPDYTALLDAPNDALATNADALGALGGVERLGFVPGTSFEYSNSNYLLLAVAAERAGERRFADQLTTRVLQPLGMDSTFVRDERVRSRPRTAVGYSPRAGQLRRDVSEWRQTGDGAVHATVEDLLAWASNLTSFELGGDELRAAMLTPGPQLDHGVGYGGGLSVSRDPDGALFVEHSGAWAGYGAHLVARPDDGLAVVVLCNRSDVDAVELGHRTLERWRVDD